MCTKPFFNSSWMGIFTFGFHMRSGSLWSLFLRLSLLSCLLVALSYGGPETKMAPVNASALNGMADGDDGTMTCTTSSGSMRQRWHFCSHSQASFGALSGSEMPYMLRLEAKSH